MTTLPASLDTVPALLTISEGWTHGATVVDLHGLHKS
jgi:hypothetical protein